MLHNAYNELCADCLEKPPLVVFAPSQVLNVYARPCLFCTSMSVGLVTPDVIRARQAKNVLLGSEGAHC